MKRILMAISLSIALTVIGCRRNTETIIRPSDFIFVFEFSSCGPKLTHSFDTGTNTLTYSPKDGTKSSVVEMLLTDDQLNLIFQKITDINFFNYPEIFRVPDEQIHGYQTPSGIHKLTVTSNSQEHSVTWTDEILTKEPYMDEINLRELALMILNMIWSSPTYKNLPVGEMCA